MSARADQIAALEAAQREIAATMRDRAARCRTMTIAQMETEYRVDLLATVATVINADLSRRWAELDTAIMLAKAQAGAADKSTAIEGPGGPQPAA